MLQLKLAELLVEIGARTAVFDRALSGVRGGLLATSNAMNRVSGLANTLFIGAAGGALVALGLGLRRGVNAAEDLGESLSKANVVFGTAAGTVLTQVDKMAQAFGLPKQQLIDAASSIGLIGKAAGQSQQKAAEMANQMAKLAADASSFYNVGLDEALGKIKSGLVGESEPLRAFGVLLNENAVNAEAMRLNLTTNAKAVSEQNKVLARASLITRGMADATGDLERTLDSSKNQARKFSGSLTNLLTDVGGALLPIKAQIISTFSSVVGAAGGLFEANRSVVSGWADSVVSRLDTVRTFIARLPEVYGIVRDAFMVTFGTAPAEAVGAFASKVGGAFSFLESTVGIFFRNLPELLKIAQIRFEEMGTNVVAIVQTIPQNLGIMAEYIGNNWVQLIADAANAVGSIFSNLSKNIGEFANAVYQYMKDPTAGFQFDWTPLLEDFKATADKLPDLVQPALESYQDRVDAVQGRIAANEAARASRLAQQTAAATAANQTAAAAAATGETFKSQQLSLADASRKLRAGTGDDTSKKHLEVARRSETRLEKIEKYNQKMTDYLLKKQLFLALR